MCENLAPSVLLIENAGSGLPDCAVYANDKKSALAGALLGPLIEKRQISQWFKGDSAMLKLEQPMFLISA